MLSQPDSCANAAQRGDHLEVNYLEFYVEIDL